MSNFLIGLLSILIGLLYVIFYYLFVGGFVALALFLIFKIAGIAVIAGVAMTLGNLFRISIILVLVLNLLGSIFK